jgi:hypothetical protein
MVASSTQGIVARRLSSRAGRTLRAILQRLPRRVQRLGVRALAPVVRRWSTLAALLGIDSPRESRTPAWPDSSPPMRERPEDYLRLLRADPDPVERARAARVLARRVSPEVTTALVDALRDPSAEVAADAAEALANHPTAATVPALRAVVDNTDGFFNTAVRAAAIRTLSTVLPRGEGTPIADAVRDVDAEVSIAAIAGLVDRREEASTDALLAVIENPRGFYLDLTRRAAARGLFGLTPAQGARVRTVLQTEPEGALRDLLSDVLRREGAAQGTA